MSKVKGSKHRNLVQLAHDASVAKDMVESGGSICDMDHKNLALRGAVAPTKQDELSIVALKFIRQGELVSRDSYFEYMEKFATRLVALDTVHTLKRNDYIAFEGENLRFLKVSKALEVVDFDNELLSKLENKVYTTKEITAICGVGRPTIMNRLLSMVKRGKIEAVGAGKWKLPGVEIDESVEVVSHRGDVSNAILDCISVGIVTPTDIANRIDSKLANTTAILNHLKRKGWVKTSSRGVWTMTPEGSSVYNNKEN